MKLAAVCLGMGLLLLLLLLFAMRAGEGDASQERGAGRTLPAGKSPQSRGPERESGDDRVATKRAREILRREDPRVKGIWQEGSYEHSLVGDLLLPFDVVELKRLAKEKRPNFSAMTTLVLRASAERHPGFQDLLARPELREEPTLDMALCAYDYAVNGNREALQRIVEWHRAAGGTQEGGWGRPASRALAYVDEWDLAKQALGSHRMSADGAGGYERYIFWLNRRYLFPLNRDFPDDYQRFVEELKRQQGESGDER